MANPNRWLKQADVMSALGAGVLGAGVGALFANWLIEFAAAAVFIGIAVHGWGMFEKHRLGKVGDQPRTTWETVLYWGCWVVLAMLAGSIIYRGIAQMRW